MLKAEGMCAVCVGLAVLSEGDGGFPFAFVYAFA